MNTGKFQTYRFSHLVLACLLGFAAATAFDWLIDVRMLLVTAMAGAAVVSSAILQPVRAWR